MQSPDADVLNVKGAALAENGRPSLFAKGKRGGIKLA